MFYKKMNLMKLYEEALPNATEELPVIDDTDTGTDVPAEEEDVSQKEDAKALKKQKIAGRTYGWPIDQVTYDELVNLIAEGKGLWTAKEPIKTYVAGKDGEAAMIGTKPVYLQVRLMTDSKVEKHETTQIEEDREFVLLDTTATTLTGWLEKAVNITNLITVSVSTPFLKSGKETEHSLNLWLDNVNQYEEEEVSAEETPAEEPQVEPVDDKSLEVDGLDNVTAQMDNPGTPAGITEEPNESKRYFYSPKEVEEQMNAVLEGINEKRYYDPDVGAGIGVGAGSAAASGVATPVAKKETPVAKKETPVAKKKTPVAKKKTYIDTLPSTNFKQEQGNAFRKWANSTDELKKRYGSGSKYDLDTSGKPNNSFIRKAYAAAKGEYEKAKNTPVKKVAVIKTKEPEKKIVKKEEPKEIELEDMSVAQLKGKLKTVKYEKKKAKKEVRKTKKEIRQEKRLSKKEARIIAKIKRKELKESVVYDFDSFIENYYVNK